MAIYKRDIVDINLETGNIHRSFLKHSIGYLDQAADHFGIRVLRNGEPVDLTGVTVQGIFMPPQGNPIAITTGNIVEGNVAEVVLPQACYNYDGQFCLSIKLVDATNAITGTMRIVDGMVDNTHASGTVAPTGSVPTYQEILAVYDDMVDALADVADYAANFAPAFAAGTANAAGSYVMYEGDLYLLPNGHEANVTWANTTKTQVNIGSQVSDLKSALKREVNDINGLHGYAEVPCDMIINSSKKWTNATNGTHLVILVNPGDTINLTANANYSTIIALLRNYEPVHGDTPLFSEATGFTDRISTTKGTSASFTVPSDAQYLYVMMTTGGNTYTPSVLTLNGFDMLVGVRATIELVKNAGLRYIGGVTSLGLTKFEDIADIGYVYFTSVSVENITDKPSNLTGGGVCINYQIPNTTNKFQVIYSTRKMWIRNITSSTVIEWTELTEPAFKNIGTVGTQEYTSFADADFGFVSFTTAQGQAMPDKPEGLTTGGICCTYPTTAAGKYQVLQSTRGMWHRYVSAGGTAGEWYNVDGSADDTKYLAGKKFSIIGDSISTYQGYVPSGYPSHYPGESDVTSVSKTWWKIVEKVTGMTLLKNASWSGSGVSFGLVNTDTLANAKVAYSDNRINDLADRTDPENVIKPDIIIILIGTNDFRKVNNEDALPGAGMLGNFTELSEISDGDSEIKMFNEAYACMLNKIHNEYPEADVFCCTLLARSAAGDRIYPVTNSVPLALSQYNEVIENVATWLNCNVIRTDSVFNLANIADYMHDSALHPNADGMKMIANRVVQGLIDKERKFV